MAYNNQVHVTPQTGGLALTLDHEEIGHLNNALNEVCNGLAVANFEAAIGLSNQQAIDLLKRVHRLAADEPLHLTLNELYAIRNSLTAVLAELEPWEFASRMGFEVGETEVLRNRLDALASEVRYGSLRRPARVRTAKSKPLENTVALHPKRRYSLRVLDWSGRR